MLDDIETETRTMSRSALRHRPIMPDAQGTQVQIRRASRIRQQPYAPDDLAFESSPKVSAPRRTRDAASRAWLVYVVLGMLMTMLLLWAAQSLLAWINVVSDDLHYGRPRTTQVDHLVSHETGNTPTHFIATNVNGQVYIVEIPGGNPGASHLLVGPHLIGPGADLAPVSLSFPGDPQHPDLLVTIDGIAVRFRNTGSAFVPAS